MSETSTDHPIHRILIATEDTSLASRICQALEGDAFRAQLVSSRSALLSSPRAADCDIVMVDEAIGAVDGWECARALRQASGGRPVVIVGVVGTLDPSLVTRQKGYDVEGFVRKSGMEKRLADGLQILARNIPPRPADDADPYLKPERLRETMLEPALGSLTTDWVSTDLEGQIARGQETRAEREQSTDSFRLQDIQAGIEQLEAEAEGPVLERTMSGRKIRSTDLSGCLLGKVRLVRVIGEGAGGTVYEGLHTNLDLAVAVKVLHADLVRTDTAFAMRFLSEARLAARVAHANVVRVLDCDRDEANTGAYYIVMEYVRGRSLDSEIRIHSKVAEERLLGIAIGVSHALVAAEEEGVIHRDIKPGNILLLKDDAVKVADLGLAQRAQRLSGLRPEGDHSDDAPTSGDGGSRIADQSIVGTPYYISPEQIADSGHVDIRSDIYSLGCTLYHAVTGTPPYTGNTVADVLLGHLEGSPVAPVLRNHSVSPAFSRLLMKMLATNPDERPSGHREVLSTLRDHLQDLRDEKRWQKANVLVRAMRRLTSR